MEPKRKINRDDVLDTITKNWPVHVTEIAEKMGYLNNDMDEAERKLAITHVKYHVDQLARNEKIRVKKIGKALVTWPIEIEKLRLIHEMLRV